MDEQGGCVQRWRGMLMRRKPLKEIHESLAQRSDGLAKSITAMSLVSLGVGAVVGAGIFVLTGQAAAKYAGPALSLSFVVSAFACFFTGMCYAELASTIPIAGSAYSYVYVAIGELFAFVVAMCLTLEYLFSGGAVAVGWSAAFQDLLGEFGVHMPEIIAHSPLVVVDDELQLSGCICNVPAMCIIATLTCIISVGVKESTRFNNFAVGTKLSVLLCFVGYGIYFAVKENGTFRDNLDPFIPPNEGKFGKYGISGIFRGAGAIFFAYIGFDAVCAMAQECKNPEKDLPRGLLGTLVICTILYITVTLSLTGLMNYTLLNVESPVTAALVYVDAYPFFRYAVEVGTIAGLTSVCLVSLMSMPRVVWAVASDGLLPAPLSRVHPRFQTPVNASLLTGLTCCVIAGTFPLDFLGELISFGTLIAFSTVCAGVLRLRQTHPDHPRPFKTPGTPIVPILGILTCFIQLFSLPPATWRNCAIWLTFGLIYYFVYARRKSNLARAHDMANEVCTKHAEVDDEEMLSTTHAGECTKGNEDTVNYAINNEESIGRRGGLPMQHEDLRALDRLGDETPVTE